MDDQLDNDLRERIREVFENYEDTTADEGWLLLREKYPEKDKRRMGAWLWWAPAAALLLIFMGILWFKLTPEKGQQVAVVKHQQAPVVQAPSTGEKKANDSTGNNAALADQPVTGAKSTNTSKALVKTQGSKTENSVQPKNSTEVIASNYQKAIKPMIAKGSLPQDQVQNKLSPSNKTDVTASIKPSNQTPVNGSSKNASVINTDTGALSKAKTYAAAPTTEPGINMQEQQAKKADKNLFADDNQPGKKPEKTNKGDNAVRFGVYAATYFNYAKGSSNQFNLGAGLTSDIRLTDNLNLSTGVSVGQNTLSYATQPPQTQAAVSSANSVQSLTIAAAYSPSKLVYSPTSPAFKNYSANLIGLDVPVNLKFVFDPKKNQTYILAGVSSGTFINETYTYNYNDPSLFSSSVSQVQGQSTHNSFNSFYFAKTLNLAFGTGYLIGRNRLVVEPFLKYPLEGLGSQQIKFGAGGINLKFNLQGAKK